LVETLRKLLEQAYREREMIKRDFETFKSQHHDFDGEHLAGRKLVETLQDKIADLKAENLNLRHHYDEIIKVWIIYVSFETSSNLYRSIIYMVIIIQ